MLKFEDLPEDNADLAKIKAEFRRLKVDLVQSCPVPIQEILDYLSKESPSGSAIKLKFLRTAKVAYRDYWSFIEEDATEAHVTVFKEDVDIDIGYSPNVYNSTPEQFLLGDYYEVF